MIIINKSINNQEIYNWITGEFINLTPDDQIKKAKELLESEFIITNKEGQTLYTHNGLDKPILNILSYYYRAVAIKFSEEVKDIKKHLTDKESEYKAHIENLEKLLYAICIELDTLGVSFNAKNLDWVKKNAIKCKVYNYIDRWDDIDYKSLKGGH